MDLDDLLGTLKLEPTGPGTFRGANITFGHGGPVFGGQLMAQTDRGGARPARRARR